MEFLVYMEVLQQPSGDQAQKLLDQEAGRAKELAAAGIMRRLWRVPGQRANWGIWTANTADELREALSSLPLFPYMSVTVHPLTKHPNDPKLPLT
jgi:muconolactone delta-isomerase